MKTVFGTLVASLVVVLALLVLISEDQWKTGNGSLTIHGERVSTTTLSFRRNAVENSLRLSAVS